jgi:indole-3-glycerol phosphate synthase
MSAELGALAPIVARKASEVETLRCAGGALWAKAELMAPAPDISAALRGGAVVAEMKRRSPGGGHLRPDLDPATVGREYQEAGAAGISVLTDAAAFGGSLDDLAVVRAAVTLPLLRKDFTIDPLQIAEARVAGADWVLLIAALLDDRALEECLEATRRAGAYAVLEVHTSREARRAVASGAECIGVNNRDLRTLQTDLSTFAAIRPLIPDHVVCIAESGVRTAGDVTRLVGEGADAVLVGAALMRSDSPRRACAELVAAGRHAASARP